MRDVVPAYVICPSVRPSVQIRPIDSHCKNVNWQAIPEKSQLSSWQPLIIIHQHSTTNKANGHNQEQWQKSGASHWRNFFRPLRRPNNNKLRSTQCWVVVTDRRTDGQTNTIRQQYRT